MGQGSFTHEMKALCAWSIYLVGAYRDNLDTLQIAILPVWKKFLLNQFHDVIPGSCIEQVVSDALEIYNGKSAWKCFT